MWLIETQNIAKEVPVTTIEFDIKRGQCPESITNAMASLYASLV